MGGLENLIRNAPFSVFLFMFGIPLLLAGIGLVAGLLGRRNANALAGSKPISVSKVTDGVQLVEGMTSQDNAMSAPLTGRSCVWFDIKVEENVYTAKTDQNDSDHRWAVVRAQTSTQPIEIVEGGARILADPTGATVYYGGWSEWYGPFPDPEERNPELYSGETVPGGSGRIEVMGDPARRFRYTEKYVFPDQPVFAFGLVETRKRGGKLLPRMRKPGTKSAYIISTRSPETIAAESNLAVQGGLVMAVIMGFLAFAVVKIRFG